MSNEIQNVGGSEGAVPPPISPLYDVGKRAEHRKYGPVLIQDNNAPGGVLVLYENLPVEFKDEVDGTEDIVSVDDLQSASPYSDEAIVQAIRTHFRILFEANDRVCITFIRPINGKDDTDNFCVPFSKAISKTSIVRMRARNEADFNVYVSNNPVAPNAVRRIKGFAGEPRNVFMDVDVNGDHVLEMVRASVAAGEVPVPSVVLRSSKGKYQFIWRINSEGFTAEKVEAVNQGLCERFGGDLACTDVLRVFRIPGLRNHKYPIRPVVEVIETHDGNRWNFEDFKIPVGEKTITASKPAAEEIELSSVVAYFEDAATQANIRLSMLKKWGDSGWIWELTCPWVTEHTGQKDSGTVVILHKSGALDFVCQHGHCSKREWSDFHSHIEELVGRSLRFGDSFGGVTLPAAISIADYSIAPTDSDTAPGPVLPVAEVGEVKTESKYSYSDGPDEASDMVKDQEDEKEIGAFKDSNIVGICSDFVELSTRGTTLLPRFPNAIAKTLLGAKAAGKVAFEGFTTLPLQYLAEIGRTGAGKGESYKRCMAILRPDLYPHLIEDWEPGKTLSSSLWDCGLKIFQEADSGAGLIDLMFDSPDYPAVMYVDEVSKLGDKTRADRNPEILKTLLELSENTVISRVLAGQKEKRKQKSGAYLASIMCGQPAIWPSAFAGMKTGVLGWFDRITPEFSPTVVPGKMPAMPARDCVKLYEKFTLFDCNRRIGMTKAADSVLEDFLNSRPEEERRKARFRKNLFVDAYLTALSRLVPAVEPLDAYIAIDQYQRQMLMRKLFFVEAPADRISFYQAGIKKFVKEMWGRILSGEPKERVAMTYRDFATKTRAYTNDELHFFERAFNIYEHRLLTKAVVELNVRGGGTRKIEKYLPKAK